MSPPSEVPSLYQLESHVQDLFDIDVVKDSLGYVYRRLGLHIERWYIRNIIENLCEPRNHTDIDPDDIYARHVATVLREWVNRRMIAIDRIVPPIYIRDVSVDTLISSSFFEIANACYVQFGNRSVIVSLSEKFGVVPNSRHLFSYINQQLVHMQDPLYVPERNEGTDMILEVMQEWLRNGQMDDTPF